MKKTWIIIRLFVASLLIALILSKIETSRVFDILSGIRPFFLLLLLVISFLMVLISCLKWKIFLDAGATDVRLSFLIAYYMIGYFFNNLLPSSMGGDAARSYLLGKDIRSHSKSISSVFWERFTGLIALVVIGAFAMLLNRELISNFAITVSMALMSCFLVAVGLVFLWERPKRIIANIAVNKFGLPIAVRDKVNQLFASINTVKTKKKELAKSLLYSFLFQGMTIVNVLVCCLAIGVYPDVLDLAVTVPIIMLISLIPISIGGLGLWEGSFAFFFSLFGISPVEAVTVALILRGKNLLLGLCGGFLLLLRDWMGWGEQPFPLGAKPKSLI